MTLSEQVPLLEGTYPIFKKKDKSIRICIDYRGLNKVTVKNKYLLLKIDNLFNQLRASMMFSNNDMRLGYHQVKVVK